MSDLVILRQPKACQQSDVEFLHAPGFAWYVRSLVDAARYEDVMESEVTLESLAQFGEDTWDVLAASGLFRAQDLARTRQQLTQPDGSTCFYPLVRLRSSSSIPLAWSTGPSPQEQELENDRLLAALAANRLQVTRVARQRLGSGEVDDAARGDRVSAVELLELELSDESLLLGWGWVWYRV
jgi:hypothetical protein